MRARGFFPWNNFMIHFRWFPLFFFLQANKTPDWASSWYTNILSRKEAILLKAPRYQISRDQTTVHTTPGEFENVALFLRLFLQYTLIRSVSRMLFKPEEFENAGFAFSCGQKTFWKQSFSKNDDFTIMMYFLCPSFPQTQIPNARDCYVSSGVVWTGA